MVDTAPQSIRISSLQRRIEERVANPVLRWLLRSRLHRLASRWLLLLSYTGRRSGRRYTAPVAYARHEGDVLVVTPERESNWWRNFTEPRRCGLWLRGVDHAATGRVVTGAERERLLAAHVDRHGLLCRLFGVEGPDDVVRASQELAVVRFSLREEQE